MGDRYVSYNIVNENNEPFWTTADGLQIPFSEVTHQHWSNIYWYNRYIYENACEELKERNNILTEHVKSIHDKCQYLMAFAHGQIEKRFDGEMLDWVPKYDNEKKWYAKQSTRKILIEKIKDKKVDVRPFNRFNAPL